MAVDMSRMDVPRTVLEQQIAELVVRQNDQRAEESAARLRAFFAPNDTQPEATPEEGTS
jgi:hypothetical protein